MIMNSAAQNKVKHYYDSGNLFLEISISTNGKMNGKYIIFFNLSGYVGRIFNHVDDIVEGELLTYEYEFSYE